MNSIHIKTIKLSCTNCSLSELCLPRGLSEADLSRFEVIVDTHPSIPKGGSLYRAGEPCYALYAIKLGAFKSVMTAEDGHEQIVGFHMPGELVGFDGVDSVHNCSVVSLERSMVCELPLRELELLSKKVEGLRQEVYAEMRREISREQSMALLLARRTAEGRLASFLLSMAHRVGSQKLSRNEFNLVMSRHDIANHLGLAAETVSRMIGLLQYKEVITVDRRRVTILNLLALKERVVQPSGAKA